MGIGDAGYGSDVCARGIEATGENIGEDAGGFKAPFGPALPSARTLKGLYQSNPRSNQEDVLEARLDGKCLVKAAVDLAEVNVGEIDGADVPLVAFGCGELVLQGAAQSEAVKFGTVLPAHGCAQASTCC